MAIGYKALSYIFEGRLDDAARVLDPLPTANIDPEHRRVPHLLAHLAASKR